MDRNKLKKEIIEILTEAILEEARKRDVKQQQNQIKVLAESFATEAAEGLLKRHTPKPNEINESRAQELLALPVRRTRDSVRQAVRWCISDIKPEKSISAERIRKLVHERIDRLPPSELILLEGFFPFKNDYEI